MEGYSCFILSLTVLSSADCIKNSSIDLHGRLETRFSLIN